MVIESGTWTLDAKKAPGRLGPTSPWCEGQARKNVLASKALETRAWSPPVSFNPFHSQKGNALFVQHIKGVLNSTVQKSVMKPNLA